MNAARALALLLLLAPSAGAATFSHEIIRQNIIWYPSLAIDASGDAHLTYYLAEPGVGYSWRHNGTWTNEIVAPQIVYSTALALDPAGRPGIVYYTASNPRPYFAERSEGGVWTSQAVDELSDQGGMVSVAYDAQGRPHVAYPWHETLKHAWRDGGVWASETIDPAVGTDTYLGTSIAVDALGRVGVSYHRGTTPVFARRGAAGWTLAAIPGAQAYVGTSLAFDAQGLARFSYEETSGLHLASETANGWTTELIDAGAGHASLARDASQVAYYDGLGGRAIYARRVGGQWEKQVVDDRFRSGQEIAIALDGTGGAEIAYTFKGYTGGDLRFAVASSPVGVGDVASELDFAPPAPNPGRSTLLAFELPRACDVTFAAYDARGRLLATRAPQHFEAGRNAARWAPALQAGAYFVRLTTSTGESAVRRWTRL